MPTNYAEFKFVLRISPRGKIDIYIPDEDETLYDVLDKAKKDQVTGEVLRTVQVSLALPPDPNAPKEPPIDIVIKG